MKFDRKIFKQYHKIRTLQGGGGITAYAYGAPAPRSQVQPVSIIDLPQVQTGIQMPGGGVDGSGKKPKFEGLPSDVEYATRMYQQKEQLRASLTEEDILTNSAKFKQYRQMEQDMSSGELENELKHNKERYTATQKTISDNSAKDAFVTSADGKILVADRETGEMAEITPGQYAQNRQKFRPMRVVDMMRARAKDMKTALNNRFMDNAESTYGLPYISKYLDNKISNIGDESSKKTRKVLDSVSRFGGDYKGLIKQMKAGGNNAQQIQAAIETTWSLLSDSMRAQVMTQVLRDNPNLNSDQELRVAAFTLVARNYDRARKSNFESSYEENIPAGEYSGGGSGGGGTDKMGAYQSTALFGTGDFKNIAPGGSGIKYNLYGKDVPTTERGKMLTDTNLSRLNLERARFQSGADVDAGEISTYQVTGTPRITMVPVDKENKPDLNRISKLNSTIQEANEHRRRENRPALSVEEIRKYADQIYPEGELQMAVAYEVIGKQKQNSDEVPGRNYLSEDDSDYEGYVKTLADKGITIDEDDWTPNFLGLDDIDRVYKDVMYATIPKGSEDLYLRSLDEKDFRTPNAVVDVRNQGVRPMLGYTIENLDD